MNPRRESLSYEREYTLVLDDWLDGVNGTPEDELKRLENAEVQGWTTHLVM